MKQSLLNFDLSEIKEIVVKFGEKPYRAVQIYTALYLGLDFSEMTSLSINFRERLQTEYSAIPVKIFKSVKSVDGTEKFLYSLEDGNLIEGVLMKYKYGYTLCVSTQVGCRMNCAFCASGLEGLIRNLQPAEILGQVIAVNRYLEGGLKDKRKIINVVLMGSGEPLDNYDNVIKFIKLMANADGINVSPRNVSLSTCGLVNKMLDLAKEDLPINLTVSLHSPFDNERQEIMPVAKTYKIQQILDACEQYFKATKRRYIFEYVLINGKNDTARHAEKLIEILKGKPCHVNLIRLNEVKEKGLDSVTDKKAYQFLGLLERGGLSATVRRKMGDDIEGACGQLRRSYISLQGE